jgi:hypothetical protein
VPSLQENRYRGVYTNKDGSTLDRAINEFGPERFIALSKDTNPLSDTTNYNLPNNYTFGDKGIKTNKPSLPNPTLPKIPPPTSLARRGSVFNAVPVPARNSIVASPVQPPINTSTATEDIRRATQIRNLRF